MKVLQEIVIPQESVNDDKVVVINLCFKNGDVIKNGDTALEFETSKATVTLEVFQDGYIYYNCTEGDEINVGSIVAKVFDEKNLNETTIIQQQNNIVENDILNRNDLENVKVISVSKTIFSKKAKSLLQEKGLNESDFIGKDFVNAADVNFYLNQTNENIVTSEELTKTKQKKN